MQRELRTLGGEPEIGVMPSVAASVVPEVLKEYKANYPDVALHILEAYSGTLMELLASGKVDLVVRAGCWSPEALRASIAGCESVDQNGAESYRARVRISIAGIGGKLRERPFAAVAAVQLCFCGGERS
jgi:DNA-binding transcriptional LysR family regulator